MRRVFISSVISGFEEYRAAAKKAVELMGDIPVMCEDFGARPYSPEIACISEVEGSDVYIVIIGEKYGFLGPNGISVTQEEFDTAKNVGKTILAFIQNTKMESNQITFKKIVEDYTNGFFRVSFSNPESLKDEIVKSLRQLKQVESSTSQQNFKARVEVAILEFNQFSSRNEPEMIVTFWPQPQREVDIVSLEKRLDEIFVKMCASGLSVYKNGYEELLGRNYTGIKSDTISIIYHFDGLIVVVGCPTIKRDGFNFDSYFVPPSKIKELATGTLSMIQANSGWCNLTFHRMENKKVAELPKENISSFSMNMSSEKVIDFNQLFIPFTERAYLEWIDLNISRLKRIFK